MHPSLFYKLLSFLLSFGGCMAVGIYLPYLHHLNLSKADIFLINAVYWLVIGVTQMATGLWADRHSRAWSVRIGIGLCALGSFIYLFAAAFHTKWSIMSISLAAEILEGFGFSFTSGAQQAWLSDALKRRGQDGEQKQTFAQAARFNSLGMLLGGSVSFLFPLVSFTFGWLMRVAFLLVSLAICCIWMNGEGEPLKRISSQQAFKASWRLLRENNALRWAATVGAAFCLIMVFNLTWVPHFEEQSLRLTLCVWLTINLGMFLGANAVSRWAKLRQQESGSLILALAATGSGLALLAFADSWYAVMGMVLIHEVGRGMYNPLMDGFIYSRVDSSYKATYGSLNSTISFLGCFAILMTHWFAMGKLEHEPSANMLWLCAGMMLMAFALVLWRFRPNKSVV